MGWTPLKKKIIPEDPITQSIVKQMESVPPIKPLPKSKLVGQDYEKIPDIKSNIMEELGDEDEVSDFEKELIRRDNERKNKIQSIEAARRQRQEPEEEIEEQEEEIEEEEEEIEEEPKPKAKDMNKIKAKKIEPKENWKLIQVPTEYSLGFQDQRDGEVLTSNQLLLKIINILDS
jgi:hypothetical protein